MIKVLLVEDSIVTQKLIMLNLEKFNNIKVLDVAFNGIEAIEKNIELSPDIIIMDYCMPKMNGLDTLKEIRKSNSTPIVFLSTQFSMKDELINQGANCFLEKNYENIKFSLVNVINDFSKNIILN